MRISPDYDIKDKNDTTERKSKDPGSSSCDKSDFRLNGNDSISCFQLDIPEEQKVAKDRRRLAVVKEMNVFENYSNDEDDDSDI